MAHKIGILSDTHSLLRPSVTKLLHTCDAMIHRGDFDTPNILSKLSSIAPFYAVRGNADTDSAFDHIPETLSLELYGVRIFVIHNRKMIRQDICGYDIILCGHSHSYECLQKNGQTWLNPGSCGRKRFLLPLTMAVLTIMENGRFQIEKIELAKAEKAPRALPPSAKDIKQTVLRVMKETDKGKPVDAIAQSCGISRELAEQICRLYLTHPGVSADGILGKMGL